MKKKLSERSDFKNAIILAADYMSNPGMNGECELGVRWLKSKTEIWQWNDECGSEIFSTLPKNATRRQIIEDTVDDERYPSSVNLNLISVYGDKPPIGDLLCLLWADDDSYRRVLKLMNCLTDDALGGIAERNKGGLLSDKVFSAFFGTWEYLYEAGIDIDELSTEINLDDITATGILQAFKQAAAEVERRDEEAVSNCESKLRPFADEIQSINAQWVAAQSPPPTRSGRYFPTSITSIRSYLESFVLREGKLPTGVQVIPGSRGYMGRQIQGATVDFDHLRKQK